MLVALLLSAGLVILGDSPALSDAALLEQAEAAFQEGAKLRDQPRAAQSYFHTAAYNFEALWHRGIRNASLCRNEGNAALLANELPRAILAYRRGLALDPGDNFLRDALAHARLKVAYPETGSFGRPPTENRPPWLPLLGPRKLLWATAFTYGLGLLTLTRWYMTRGEGLLALSLASFLGTVVLATGVVVEEWHAREQIEHPPVVIAEDGVLLRKGNGLLYPPRADMPLNRGVEATLLSARGEWLQIELSSGEAGWIPREYALVDAP
jgi:hypothetical protein